MFWRSGVFSLVKTPKMSPRSHTLSKSTFVRGCKCLKSLYLYKFHYDLRDEVSQQQQALFDQGTEVGRFARTLFPGGKDATVNPAHDYKASVKRTEQILQSECKTIYEAGFMYNNVYAAADILVIRKDGWHLYEVKSSTNVKEYHTLDAALQYYILKNLGYPVKQVSIICINNQYIRHGGIEADKLFNIHDITTEAIRLQDYVEDQLEIMQRMLKSGREPNCRLGHQCSEFYPCDFKGHCWSKVNEAEYPVTTISRIGHNLWDLVNKNIYCQSQIPGEYYFRLTSLQRQQIFCTVEQTSPPPDITEIRNFLHDISGPVSFLDFETIATAIPLFNDTHPYQQVPFQFSLHCDDGDGEYRHYEYLGDGKTDPRPGLIKQMLALLPAEGSILVYYMPFEKSRLQELAECFPQYRKQLLAICDRLVDLIVPFRNRYVYDYKMNGSASIKSVLPALFPELDYSKLNISDGGTASLSYLNLFYLTNKNQIALIRENLLEYCKMDTWAMVKLYEYLSKIIYTHTKIIPMWQTVNKEFETDFY
jgi:hypothetical protein